MIFYFLSNFKLYACLLVALTNFYLILYTTYLRFTIFKNAAEQQRLQCELDAEHLISAVIESGRDRYSEDYELIPRPNYPKTLQTHLFGFAGEGNDLGNKLFEIVALRGISESFNRTPVINVIKSEFVETLKNEIQPFFPNLVDQIDLRIIPESSVVSQQANFGACCKFDDPMKWKNRSEEHLLLYGHYFQSYKYFQHLKHEVRQWLAPSWLDAIRAETLIPAAHRDDLIICTHIRHGNYLYNDTFRPSDATFTRAATDFLVEKYRMTNRPITVVVLGNDIKFAQTVFQDKSENFPSLPKTNPSDYSYSIPENSPNYTVLLTPISSPELDLALSRIYCDVTLMTAPSSTFGWWLSYLAKPRAITYYRDIIESKDGMIREMNQDDYFPPEWFKLVTEENGKIRKFS